MIIKQSKLKIEEVEFFSEQSIDPGRTECGTVVSAVTSLVKVKGCILCAGHSFSSSFDCFVMPIKQTPQIKQESLQGGPDSMKTFFPLQSCKT